MRAKVDSKKSSKTSGRGSFFAIFTAPTLVFLLVDLLWRAPRIARFESGDWLAYFQSSLLSWILWGGLLFAAVNSAPRHRWWLSFLFVSLFTVALGSQAYFFQQYNAYINLDVSRFATNFTESVLHQLWADAGNYLSFNLPAFLVALALVFSARWVTRFTLVPYRALALLAPCLLLLCFVWPVHYRKRQASLPDVLYLHAAGGLIETQLGLTKNSGKLRPRARDSYSLPALTARPARVRNVVFVILESVRKDAVCNDFEPGCRRTPSTNALFPGRYPLSQMRSLSSSTAISMAVLWSGLSPTSSRESLHRAPLLFDYAREAGFTTAYWTSQNIMFGNMRLWLKNLGVDSMITATDVDPESDIDLGVSEDLFADRVLEELSILREPFFLTIQLSNGHYPYLVQPDGPQPFSPSSTSKAPENNESFFNHYQNAIHQEDLHLGRILGAVAGLPSGPRTVVLYTSDHGEAFREHHQMGHTFSVLDEEVLVPAWIDAPPGTLSPLEEQGLRAKREVFTSHPDLTATVLDLLGLWNEPNLVSFKQEILGQSLLGVDWSERALPMTNCSALWSCAFENWGYMRGAMKLEARAWDSNYHCWDLALDPAESVNLGQDACGDLKERAQETFGRIPGKKK